MPGNKIKASSIEKSSIYLSPVEIANQTQETALIIAVTIGSNKRLESLAISTLEFDLDIHHVDLAAQDDVANESAIVSTSASHGLVESLGEVAGRRASYLSDGQEGALNVARHLGLDGLLDVVAC